MPSMRPSSCPFSNLALAVSIGALTLSGCQSSYRRAPEVAMSPAWHHELSASETSLEKALSSYGICDETLEKLLAIAKRDSLDLRSAKNQLEMAQSYYQSEKSALFPKLNAAASASYNHPSSHTVSGASLPSSFSANVVDMSFQALWELDFFGKQRAAKRSAQASVESAQEIRRAAWIALKAEITRTYLAWCASQLQLANLERTQVLYERLHQLSCERAARGLTSLFETEQAFIALAGVRARLPLVALESDLNLHRLELLLGQAPGFLKERLKAPQAMPLSGLNPSLGVPSDLLKRRPDIRAAERKLASAAGLVEVARLDFYPSFTLTGALGHQSMFLSDLSKGSSRYWSFTPGVQLPLFNAGLLKAQLKLSQARQEQALIEYESCVLGALAEVENALSGVQNNLCQLQQLEIALQSQERLFSAVQAQYEHGLGDFTLVLQAQSHLLQAQNDHLQAQLSYLLQVAFLEKALCSEEF